MLLLLSFLHYLSSMKAMLFFFLLVSYAAGAQSIQQQLKRIRTLEEATSFIEANPASEGIIFTLNTNSDTAAIHGQIARKRKGEIFTLGAHTYKILKDTTALFSRVSYIYLDGTQLSAAQIDSLRKVILAKYNEGVPFAELATLYTMDGNPNAGDTGWFTEGTMVKEFEKALKKRKAPEVFTIDMPKDKWYYVVKKTHDTGVGKQLTVLRIKSIP